MRWISTCGLLVALTCAGLMNAQSADAVVRSQDLREGRHTEWITTGLASRASSDVQLRRLIRMFAAKEIDSEALYERMKLIREQKNKR